MTATVYIVEDDDAVRKMLCELITLGGLQVEAYASAENFLDGFTPSADRACILSDVRMPGTSGLELQKILKNRGIQLPFIIMTGYADVSMAVEAMKMGAADFIEKPFDARQLLERIHDSLQAHEKIRNLQKRQALAQDKIARLTRREKQVMELLSEGSQNRAIAEKLDISPRTVEIHRARIMAKLEANSVSDITRLVIRAAEKSEDDPG